VTERWKESEEIMKENSCRRVAERNLWSTTARREMNWKRPKNFFLLAVISLYELGKVKEKEEMPSELEIKAQNDNLLNK